jgi:uncharacterized protein (DUF433 family)
MNLTGYNWVVSDRDLLGGKPVIRGTRLSVAFVLACMAEGMTIEEIGETYAPIPRESVAEIMRLASEVLNEAPVPA